MNAVLALIGFVTVVSAAAALSLRNLIHSALLLIGSWLGVAFFFLWAGAEFAAFAQVLVYAGAVSMIVLFAVLLTRRSRTETGPNAASRGRAASGFVAAAAIGVLLAAAVLGTSLETVRGPVPAVSVHRLGELLMGPQLAAVLVVGALLTVALLGAVVLAAAGRPDEREDPR
jgi:NADH:ubiquinone oxidoreductase subunit 6 (subunit J)